MDAEEPEVIDEQSHKHLSEDDGHQRQRGTEVWGLRSRVVVTEVARRAPLMKCDCLMLPIVWSYVTKRMCLAMISDSMSSAAAPTMKDTRDAKKNESTSCRSALFTAVWMGG